MLTRLKQTVERIAIPRNVLLLFLSLLPFTFVFFPWRSGQLGANLPYSLRLFDTRLPYPPQDVHTLANDLGEDGRRLYALTEVTLDLAFPALYASFLSLTLAWVWRAARPTEALQTWLPLLPYLGMLGDLTENVCLAALMLLFPGEPAWLVWFSNLASLVKWSAGLVSLAIILVGVGIVGLKLIRPQSSS